MIFVFDLDDTLYNEKDFVYSGFRAVARLLETLYGIEKETLVTEMIDELQKNGRGNIFNTILQKRNLFSRKLVQKCLAVYRTHKPDLQLPKESIECLTRLKSYPLYVVTDGNRLVQRNKVVALRLDDYVDGILITHDHGVHNAKPSVYCFEKIRKKEKAACGDMVYIGDNPKKDFVNIKKMGYKTVRILKGDYADLIVGIEYDAHLRIRDLSELTVDLINKIA